MNSCTMKRIVLFSCLCSSILFNSSVYSAEKPFATTAPVSFFADQGTVAPTIDGFIDADEWRFSPQSSGASGSLWYVRWDFNFDDEGVIQTGLLNSSTDDEPFDVNDCNFRVYTLYDDEYLYVAVSVTDDITSFNDTGEGTEDGQTWIDDSVEIFIDGDHSEFDTSLTQASPDDQAREFATGGQFVYTNNNSWRDNEAGNPSFGEEGDWYARSEWTDTGYDIEFKIKLSIIGNPTQGSSVGFNIVVNDDDDDLASTSPARYQLLWAGETHVESTYGTLFFGPREVTAPLVGGPVIIDGVLDEGDWNSAVVESISPHTGVVNSNTLPTSAEDLSFDTYVMHDDTWLYVGIIATDDVVLTDSEPEGSHNGNTWHDDSLEVFIDQAFNHGDDTGNNRYGSADLIEGQFVLTAGNATRDSNTTNGPLIGPTDEDDWWGWATMTDTGWQGEMRFSKELLIGEGPVGINFAVNDDDPEGAEPDNQLLWQGTPHVESSYGVLFLGGESVPVNEWMVY